DVTADGAIAVARSHAELVAAGAAVVSEIDGPEGAPMISVFATSSLAGLACVVLPWLITGGTLPLHPPFSAQVSALQPATERCTLGMGGALVPRYSFPAGIDGDDVPRLRIDGDGFVDTGYPCRLDAATDQLVLTGPPAGIVSVGGYRFSLAGLQDMLATI